ncbi:MAG TPA: hypothetical protein ENI92_04405 [Bacteroidetes bacterium]|nr:hypothetical protein [Bacteroidota bacterium]
MKTPIRTLEALADSLSERTGTGPKPRLGVVVSGLERDFDAAIAAKKLGWAELRLLGEEDRIRGVLEENGIAPGECEIIGETSAEKQLSLIHSWCQGGEVDTLLMGDFSPKQVHDVISNPFHGVPVEEGVSRAVLLSMPRYPKFLILLSDPGPGKTGFDSMILHIKNGVHLARAVGIDHPKIALLSAMDMVGVDDLHTYNCRCIASQVSNRQIRDIDLEGPLSFDTAVDEYTVSHLPHAGPVAGNADILVLDSHHTRSVLALTLTCFGRARAARILLGGRVPVAITPARKDDPDKTLAIALGLYIAPYLKVARPLDWLTHPDLFDYAW